MTPSTNKRLVLVFGLMGLLAIGLGGCATSGPTLLDHQATLAQRFPEGAYITAWGVSAKGPREAELSARAMVAEQVKSSIQSELVSVMEAESKDGVVRDYEKIESRIETTAQFDHAELILLVPESVLYDDGQYSVLTVLSRRDAATELLIPYEEQARSFRLLSEQLEEFAADPPRFTSVWRQMQPHRKQMLPLAAEVRAVAGRTMPEIADDEHRWEMATARRSRMLNEMVVVLDLGEAAGLDNVQLSNRMREALADLGLGAVSESCQAGALHLKIEPQLEWKRVMGKVAQLNLPGEVGLCFEDEIWTDFQLGGSRYRGEGRQPLVDLMSRVKAGDLEKALKGVLEPYLPF